MTFQKSSITNLNIFYGYRCNLSCIGCLSGSDAVKTKDLDPDLSKTISVLPQLAERFDITGAITLLGGDPLLYWEERIIPITREIRKHFQKEPIVVFTNALLIDKYKEKIFDYILEFAPVHFTITRHLDGLGTNPLKAHWDQKITNMLSDPRVQKIHDSHYHLGHYHDHVIYFHRPEEWRNSYKLLPDGRIKPFATNDPQGSMAHGCTGSECSAVIEDRLYKCANLATLEKHLQALDQLEDPDWKKYLDYPYIDLNSIDEDRMQFFAQTHGSPVSHCDMCNNNPKSVTPWHRRDVTWVLPQNK